MQQDLRDVTGEQSASATVGQILRAAREARGESLADAAYALKLTQRQVEAIESERFESLPGPAFVRGFIRNYARHLDLDAEAMVAMLKPEWTGQPAVKLAPVTNAAGAMPDGSGTRKVAKPAGALIAGLLALLALGWYFDWFRVSEGEVATQDRSVAIEVPRERAEPAPVTAPGGAGGAAAIASEAISATEPVDDDSVPGTIAPADRAETETSAAAPETAAPVDQVVAAESPSEANQPVVEAPAATDTEATAAAATGGDAVGDQLVFRLQGESWIQVRDADGAVLFVGTDRAGTSRTVQGKPPFALVVGNAAAVSLEFRGEAVDLVPHTRSGGVARLTVR